MRASGPRPFSFRLFFFVMATLCGLLAILAVAAPWSSRADAWPTPALLMVVVAWWRATRREDMPLGLVFALGAIQDLIASGLVGPTVIPLLAIAFAPSDRVEANGGRIAKWMVFAALAAAYGALSWALWTFWTQTYGAAAPQAGEAVRQFGVTVVIYPLVAAALRRIFGSLCNRDKR